MCVCGRVCACVCVSGCQRRSQDRKVEVDFVPFVVRVFEFLLLAASAYGIGDPHV